MKVALVVPTYEYRFAAHTYLAPSDFPVGLAYLAAALKKAGHEVIGLNVNNNPSYTSKKEMVKDMMTAMLEKERPDLIGLGGLCSDYAFIRDAMAVARSIAPDTPIVCGGGIITHDAQFVFNALKPDYCIKGEAEEALVQLVEHLESGKPSLLSIPNLGYWRDGNAVFTPENFSYPSLENRPWPDYSPFEPEKMLAASTHGARLLYRYSRPNPRIMPFVAARNCPFKCTFCVHQQGPKYSTRPMADIFAEIDHLYQTYKFNVLIILDELFAIDKGRLKEFCDGILERRETLGWDFDWLFQTHASVGLTREDMELARKAGCYYFSYGLESASPRVLASMKKKINPGQIEEAIELSAQAKIGFGGNFIFGDIAETPETIAESMSFLMKNCLDMQIYTTNISPYPGSLLFDYCLQQGIIKDKLRYYETIDQVTYNMTTMPDSAWINWLRAIVWPLTNYPFVISVEPTEVSDEAPGPEFLAPPVRQVKARCPHCGEEQTYRHPITSAAIDDGTANFVPGCVSCGQRFRIQFNKDKRYTGAVLGRQIAPEALTRTIQDAIMPLAGPRERQNILLISSETMQWQPGHSQNYLSGMGLEEGFTANGMTCLTVPALREFEPGDSRSWLSHLKAICTDKHFDQVWVELTQTRLDDPALTFISALAPIKVGLVGESLQFGEPIYRIAPEVKAQQRSVDKRLRYMTHLLASDENDARWLRENKKLQALWWLPAIPQRLIRTGEQPPALTGAILDGVQDGTQDGLMPYQPGPDLVQIQQLFDQTNQQVVDAMNGNKEYVETLLGLHSDSLRQLHRIGQECRLATLSQAAAVVPALGPGNTYLARILEAMASGRPVVAAEIPGYPRLEALFVVSEDMLRLPQEGTGDLNKQLERLQAEPGLAAQIAANASHKLGEHHTMEHRVRQIMGWIQEAREPVYGEHPAADSAPIPPPAARLAHDSCQTPAAMRGFAEPIFGDQNLIALVAKARQAYETGDLDHSMLILDKARQSYPLNADLINLHTELSTLRAEKVRSRVLSAWAIATPA